MSNITTHIWAVCFWQKRQQKTDSHLTFKIEASQLYSLWFLRNITNVVSKFLHRKQSADDTFQQHWMHKIQPNLRVFHCLVVRKMSSETFKGVPLSEIYGGRSAFDLDHLPPIENKRGHTVLYKVPITVDWSKTPEPYRGESKWDQHHVRMPYAPQSEHKSENTVWDGFRICLVCI